LYPIHFIYNTTLPNSRYPFDLLHFLFMLLASLDPLYI
jgi:hypothetical protein